MKEEKTVFYYLRDEKNAPRVTVCLYFASDGFIYRGISICAKEDAVNKATGRAIAKGRAIKASKRGTFLEKVKRTNIYMTALRFYFLEAYPTHTLYKATPVFRLTAFEEKLRKKLYKEKTCG